MTKKPTYEELEKRVQELEQAKYNHEYPIKDQHEKITNIDLVSEDITAQINTEEVLQKSHSELELEIQEPIAERLKSVDAIMGRKELSEKIIQTSNAIIVGLNKNHKIVLFNLGAEKITGFSSREVIGRDWFKIFFKNDICDEMDKVWGSAWGAMYNSYINPIQTKNGNEKIISWQSTGMYDHADETKHMLLSIGEDITERIQAEEELKYTKLQLEFIFNNLDSSIYITDMKSNEILFMNEHMKNIFGEDLTGKICWQVIHKNMDAPCEFCKNDKLIDPDGNPEKPYVWEHYNQTLQNWYELRDQAIPWIDGRLVRMQIATDISDRKKTEDALGEKKSQLRQIIDLVPHYIFVKDGTGRFEIANKATAEVFGTTVEDLIGRREVEFAVNDEEIEQFRSDDLEVIKSGKTKFIPEELITDSENNIRYLQTTKVPFNFSGSKKPSLLGVSVDITERKQIENALTKEMSLRSILIEALPYPTMLIKKDRTVIFANKSARDVGARVGGLCWQDFGHSEYIPDKDKEYINQHKTTKGLCSQCTFCLADDALSDNKSYIAPEVKTFGKIFKTYWVPVSSDLFLHYARDVTEEVKAEETLRQYEYIISATNDHMSLLDRDYTYRAVNNAYLIAHKEERSQIIDHSVVDSLGIDVFEQFVKDKLDRCFAGEEVHYQNWFDFSELGKRYMDVAYYPYTGADEIISGVVVSSHDITELKQAEEELKYSKLQLEAVFNNLDSIIYITDMDSYEILHMNDYLKELLGKDYTGNTCWKSFHENQDEPCDFCTNDKLIDANGNPKEPYVWEIFNQKAKRWYELHDQAIPWTDGRLVRLEIAFDITERKNSEIAVKRREQYLNALNSASQLLLIPTETPPLQEIVDLIGPVSQASRAYIFINHHSADGNLLTSQKAEWCVKGITSEINNPDLQNMAYDVLAPRLKETLQRGDVYSGCVADFPDYEREVLEPQGILSILIIPIMLDKEFIGFIGFDNCVSAYEWDSVDLTFLGTAAVGVGLAVKRMHAENTIRNSLDEKVVLLREIHHRVKNNMQVIISFLRVHGRKTNDANLNKIFDECRDRINAMGFIHESLYQSDNLARIDFKVYLKKLCLNLNMAYGASFNGILLTVDKCDVTLNMDQGIAIGMVITELISNAFKHAFPPGRGGNVSINLSELDAENVKLIIKDNGIGIPPEIDIMNSPTLGLQLAVSAVTLELGGSIEMDRNKGTQFTICFKYKRK